MGNLFGITRRRAPVVTAHDRAILQLKQQRDKIRIYQKRTEADLEKNKDLALKLFQNGHKDRALIVLRRKKNMEAILGRTDQQLETLEQLVNDIEYTQIEVSVIEGLKVGSEALKQLNSLMNVDDIQQMMEDNEEAAAKQREISEILSKTSERYDEQELLDELEKYKTKEEPAKTVAPAQKNKVEDIPAEQVVEVEQKLDELPQVPIDVPPVIQEEKQDETKEEEIVMEKQLPRQAVLG